MMGLEMTASAAECREGPLGLAGTEVMGLGGQPQCGCSASGCGRVFSVAIGLAFKDGVPPRLRAAGDVGKGREFPRGL